jgi:8-oxo-dGTP diphosphatase
MKPVKTTVGCIIEKDGKILLTLRNIEPFKDHWCLPGGHIDFGETPEEAVKREIKEETGLDIKPRFFDYYNEFYEKMGWHAIVLMFYAKAEGEIKKDKEEVKEVKLFSKKEIFKLRLAFEHKRVLEDYFKR